QTTKSKSIQSGISQTLPSPRAEVGDTNCLKEIDIMPESTQTSVIGKPQPRIDGPFKVSGTAMYASDFHFPDLLYAVPIEATIANGKIQKLDTAAAEKMPGVRAISRPQPCPVFEF